MSYTESLEEKKMMGIAIRTVNQKNHAEIDIPKHWRRFYEENIYEKIPNKVGNEVYGVYIDYEKDYTKPYTLLIGCEVSTFDHLPKGLVGKILPASVYAVFDCKGKFPDSVINKWQDIWASQMKRTYTGDFELYPVNFDPEKHHDVKIFISVKT